MNKLFYFSFFLVFLSAWNANAQRKNFVDVAGIDPSIKLGDNFFRHVNGRWYDGSFLSRVGPNASQSLPNHAS